MSDTVEEGTFASRLDKLRDRLGRWLSDRLRAIDKAPRERWRVSPWDRTALPILISAGIIFYNLSELKWADVWSAGASANLWLALPSVAVPHIAWWFLSTLLTERYFKWFHGPFPYWKYFWVHGSVHMLDFINPAVSGGVNLIYQKQKSQIGWFKLLGMVLFYHLIPLGMMAFLLVPLTLTWHYYGLYEVVGKFQLDGYVYGWLWIYVWWAILLFGIYWFTEAWFSFHRSGRLIGVTRLFFLFTRLLLGEEKANDLWTVARSAEPRHWLGTLAITVPNYFMFLFSPYLLSLAFDVNIPFFEFVVLAIPAMFVADLPISFSGFGTTTMSWMIFFGAYGSPENIAALTLFMPFGRVMTHAFIGLIAIKPGLAELRTLSLSALLKPGGKAAVVPAAVVPRESCDSHTARPL